MSAAQRNFGTSRAVQRSTVQRSPETDARKRAQSRPANRVRTSAPAPPSDTPAESICVYLCAIWLFREEALARGGPLLELHEQLAV